MLLGITVFGALLVAASGPMVAVLRPINGDDSPSEYDSVDRAWLENTMVMPELAPQPKSVWRKIITTRRLPGL